MIEKTEPRENDDGLPTSAESTARAFCDASRWNQALWLATTFRCHPTNEAPPVLGFIFADWKKGVDLFQSWIREHGNADAYDDIRIAIIEGDIPGYRAGYSVRLSPAQADWEFDHTANDQAPLGIVQRMHPLPETDMLGAFKKAYEQHQEYLIVPTIERDGQLWFDTQYGIIKRELVLRHSSDVAENEPDFVALMPPRDIQVIAVPWVDESERTDPNSRS